jgi:hypothetical protein
MPVLIQALRNYGLREYGLTLSIAVVCGLGLAALLNASAGGKGGEATLKTKAQIASQSSRLFTTRVAQPVRVAHPVRRHHVHHARHRHHRSHARRHYAAPTPAPATQLVSVRTPKPSPAPKPAPVKYVAPKPIVRAPAPRPAPKPAPKKPSGGGLQFDDSG